MRFSGTVAADNERQRIQEIINFLEPLGEEQLCRALIADTNASVATARRLLLLSPSPGSRVPTRLGLTRAECARYSLSAAILAGAAGAKPQGFELECHRGLCELHEPLHGGTLIPIDVIEHSLRQRDLTAGLASGGGYLAETTNAAGFVSLARGRMITGALGAEILEGLVGNVTIPCASTSATHYWVDEGGAPSESAASFAQIAMTPKTVGVLVEVSRRLVVQTSPQAQALIANELVNGVAAAVDSAAISGSGASGQPIGLLASLTPTSGASLAHATIQAAEAATDAGMVDGSIPAWATTPTVARLLQTRVRFSNTSSPLWVGSYLDGQLTGNPARSSSRMPTGVACFGDWSQLVVGSWGTLEIERNPYSKFADGVVAMRCLFAIDVACKRLSAFASVSGIS